MPIVHAARCLAVLAGAASIASADLRSVTKVIAEGDPLIGSPSHVAQQFWRPVTDGNGVVGFAGVSGGLSYIWKGGEVLFHTSSLAGHSFQNLSVFGGLGNNGEFGSFAYDFFDGKLWTNNGPVMNIGDPAPGMPGKFVTQMTNVATMPDGAIYWHIRARADDFDLETGAFYRIANTASPVIEQLLIGGKTYAGMQLPLDAFPGGSYDVSDNGENYINLIGLSSNAALLSTPSGRTYVARYNMLVPGSATEKYETVHFPHTNNRGDYLVPANTNSTGFDEIIVYNGQVVLREGDTVDGRVLGPTPSQTVRVAAASVDNSGNVAHIWYSTNSVFDYLFYGQGVNLRESSRLLLAGGDELDFNDDGLCDARLVEFDPLQGNAPGIDLADDGMVYVKVKLLPCNGGTPFTAIVGVRASCPSDWDHSGFVDTDDFDAFVENFVAGDADFDHSGFTDIEDYTAFVLAFESGC